MATEVELRTIVTDGSMLPQVSHIKQDLGSIQEPTENLSYSSSTPELTRARSIMLMVTLSGISFLNTFNSGMLTVALPTMATDLGLPTALLLWPASVFALTQGCTLLLLGAIADVVGNRPIFLAGAALFTVFTLACSLARSGSELIAFRALQGVAMAFCMPTAVSTITASFPSGKRRNVAFAVFGGGSPIGFATGLVLGGVFVQAPGWRTGYYFACGANAAILVVAWFVIPASKMKEGSVWHRLANDLDWVGVAAVSASLGMSSYVFANITYSASVIREPQNIALLTIAVLLVPAFIYWVGRQETLGRPAIIPNSVWRKTEFTAVCITVFLTWAMFNAYGYWTTLFFQITQQLSGIQAALRFLPLVIMGLVTNVVAGLVLDKIPAVTLVLIGGLFSAAAPALFAVLDPKWTYWAGEFPAMCICVFSSDLLFNISNVVITNSFPPKDQALAGGIFNTVSQLGNSIGLAVTAIVASAVTSTAGNEEGVTASQATLDGYRAAFWTCFAAAVLSCFVSTIGLRKSGKVGLKRE